MLYRKIEQGGVSFRVWKDPRKDYPNGSIQKRDISLLADNTAVPFRGIPGGVGMNNQSKERNQNPKGRKDQTRKEKIRRSKSTSKKYLTADQVFNSVASLIQQLLVGVLVVAAPIEEIAKIIAHTAAYNTTINATSRRGTNGMKAPAVRYHCRKLKGKGAKIEKEANKILRAQARSLLKPGKKYEFAIDENKQETYTKQESNYIVRSKARNGTTKFYMHATLYTIAQGKRVTISLMRIKKKMSKLSIVKTLLEAIEADGYSIKRLYLDRGFYSVNVVQYLMSKRINAIIAMPIRGEKNGLASRLHGKKSHWINDYEAHTTVTGMKLSVQHKVAVLATYQKNKRGKRGVRWYAYVVIGQSISLDRIKERYRGRFGIETSYRIKNQARGWTTSTLPEMHILYYAVSFIIQNEWVQVNWLYFRERRRGRPSGKPSLHFEDFLELLLEGCRNVLGRFQKVRICQWHKGGCYG